MDWYRFKLSSTSRVRIVLGDLAVGARVELYRGCTTKVTGVDASGTTPEVLHRTLVGWDIRGEGDRQERVVVAEVRVHGLAPAKDRGDPQHEVVDRRFHAAARRRGLQQHGRYAPCDGDRAPLQRDRQAPRHPDGGNPCLEDRITRAIPVPHLGQPARRLREGDADRIVVCLDEGADSTRGDDHLVRAERRRSLGGSRDRPQHEHPARSTRCGSGSSSTTSGPAPWMPFGRRLAGRHSDQGVRPVLSRRPTKPGWRPRWSVCARSPIAESGPRAWRPAARPAWRPRFPP